MAKKSLEEGLEEAQENTAAALPGENTGDPKISGFTLQNVADRFVAVDDWVMLHTNTPIDGQTDLLAQVTKLNPNNGTINVRVENRAWSKWDQRDSVKNFIPQDRSDWWSWPTDEQQEQIDAVESRKRSVEKQAE